MKGLSKWNAYVKYESPISSGMKVMANTCIKVFFQRSNSMVTDKR